MSGNRFVSRGTSTQEDAASPELESKRHTPETAKPQPANKTRATLAAELEAYREANQRQNAATIMRQRDRINVVEAANLLFAQEIYRLQEFNTAAVNRIRVLDQRMTKMTKKADQRHEEQVNCDYINEVNFNFFQRRIAELESRLLQSFEQIRDLNQGVGFASQYIADLEKELAASQRLISRKDQNAMTSSSFRTFRALKGHKARNQYLDALSPTDYEATLPQPTAEQLQKIQRAKEAVLRERELIAAQQTARHAPALEVKAAPKPPVALDSSSDDEWERRFSPAPATSPHAVKGSTFNAVKLPTTADQPAPRSTTLGYTGS